MAYERKCRSEFDTSIIVLQDVEHCSNIIFIEHIFPKYTEC